ncbi:hypothetical protein [Aporhodopirellula aestuarii]|uniref:Uncharacterized protein n=1 Tax=Aporhodopirellula aestuarii TaxID=2950107 RepID=A0ABT0UBM7_9BACT|nr:hypothetical protein [Aporhodopirellula aestuarii]MCM2374398.1 hypothetical protein [Aporhodopirellula aestuarii]
MNPDEAQSTLEHGFPPHHESEEWIGAKHIELTDLAGGCLMTLSSAAITCFLLTLNGALVLALMSTAAAAGVEWVNGERIGQFILFAAPISLAVGQWMMLDTLRRILRRRKKKPMHELA